MMPGAIKGMVMAAGLGERLRPLTESCPKPLLPVAGRPLIAYPLGPLRRAGIRDVVINTHYRAPDIRERLGDGASLGMRITYSHEPVILGTGGGIRNVEPFFEGNTFVVINSDVVADADIASVIRLHQERGAAATMVLRRDPDPGACAAVEVDGAGRVREILGLVGWGGEPLEKLMFAGIQVLEPHVFRYMPAEGAFSMTGITYPAMIRAGETICGALHAGYWSDPGTPERYRRTCEDIEKGRVDLSLFVRGSNRAGRYPWSSGGDGR